MEAALSPVAASPVAAAPGAAPVQQHPHSAEPPPPPPLPAAPPRYLALDAFRGFIMLMLISTGFGFPKLAEHPAWGWFALNFEHVPWEGLVFWDLIQPAFMFMVGVAMPFALAKRLAQGQSFPQLARHAAVRALNLVLLSQVLMIVSGGRLHFQLINVLSQIAFAYLLTFWIMRLPRSGQIVTAAGLLLLHSSLFFLFSGPEGAFSREGNIGQVIDKAILGYNYSGYYVTINFLTSTVTTLAGAWTGMLLMSQLSERAKLIRMAVAAACSFGGWLLLAMIVPDVKRIWTASFTFHSLGWVLVMMLAFFLVIEVAGWRRWTFPLVVLGMNSIFVYSLSIVLRQWFYKATGAFTNDFQFAGDLAPVLHATAVVLAMWAICYWLYRRRIFFKL